MTYPRIATCQFEPRIGDVDANLEQIKQLAERLPATTAVAVFPELCVSGYDLDVIPTTATPVPGRVTDRIQRIASQTGIDLVVGLPEEVGDDVANSLVYVSDHGVETSYRKQCLWGDEAAQFTAGESSETVDTPAGRVGLLLCYDLNFPELALEYAAADCDVIAVSAAWRQSFEHDWRLLCRSRALDQTCYVVGSNHVGSQSGRRHAGESVIVGPRGDVIAKTTDGMPTTSVDVVPEALTTAHRKNPVHRSRRNDDGTSQR